MNKIDKIDHKINSLATDMYLIRKTIIDKENEKKELAKKDKKRRESLKKAQKKFYNISTNLKKEEYFKFEQRVKKSALTRSAYIKKLILDDLEK